ncbi:MAG: glycosyl transferase family 2 [Bacteroidetes bacterium]|nr:MAG: glycosyl transferase family 2 [Bacteroidota bacterium]
MKISVIIPTFNEAEGIQQLISHIQRFSNSELIDEIIVVDGHSSDNTCELAERSGAKVVLSETRGRARQMNIGAELAKGEILYFLHADSFPPEDFDIEILKAVKDNYLGGCFRMQFDSKHLLLKFFAWFTRFRYNICRGGDQSLFIARELFNKIGCFNNNLLIIEDLEIIPKIKRHTTFKVIPKTIVTSVRKYRKNGFFRLQFIFSVINVLYRMGVSHEYLLNIYNKQIV